MASHQTSETDLPHINTPDSTMEPVGCPRIYTKSLLNHSKENDYPGPDTPIKTISLREVCEINGQKFSRRRGTERWSKHNPEILYPPPQDDQPPLYLSLVLEAQGPEEPFHWSLLVAHENQPGFLYQVTGDAEYMTYEPSDGPTDIVNSECFSNIYHLAELTEDQALLVKQIAELEPPPGAPDRRSATENCQGWAVRVIARLVETEVVQQAKLDMAREMLQPV